MPATQHGIATLASRYERALESIPGYDAVLADRGTALLERGDLDAAAACFEQAVRANPRSADAHGGLGKALHARQRYDDAAACFRTALALRPGDAGLHGRLGAVLLFAGEVEDARASLETAIAIDPTLFDVHYYLAIAFQLQDRLNDAIGHFREALVLRPAEGRAHNNLGTALMAVDSFAEAEVSYRRAVELDPGDAVAHFNLGNALNRQDKFAEAATHYRNTMALTPGEAGALYALGNDLQKEGVHDLAMACYERVLALEPDHLSALSDYVNSANQGCVWDDAKPQRDALLSRCQEPAFRGPLRSLLAISDDPAIDLSAARHHRTNVFPYHVPLVRAGRPAHSKIRVAYLSSEFRAHATAYLVAELFERHDRSEFEIFAFSFGENDRSPMRQRLTSAVDHFVEGRALSDVEAARAIAARGVDIAVSLMLCGKESREAVLAYRPAPIQVSYLAFPGTVGAEFLDYALVDPFVVPFDQQRYYTERLVHLPECYQVNDAKRPIAATTPTRADCGLPDSGFVFCCFNNSYKITPVVFEVWMRLLKSVPGSVLWLLRDNVLAAGNLRREAHERGVNPDRLVFAPRVTLPNHLARHRLADLFVDTLPCNAHTTASDALWAGLPVLTCAGRTFKARVAGSLLNAVGMPELIADDLDGYETLALRLAAQPEELARLKEKLERNCLTAPLFNTDRFRRHIESAYREMWRIWERGDEPRPFAVPAESG